MPLKLREWSRTTTDGWPSGGEEQTPPRPLTWSSMSDLQDGIVSDHAVAVYDVGSFSVAVAEHQMPGQTQASVTGTSTAIEASHLVISWHLPPHSAGRGATADMRKQ
eukprot:233190-Hanusia_phi.AAC.2